jgi:hypothetical protein
MGNNKKQLSASASASTWGVCKLQTCTVVKASKQASKPENVGASVFFTFHEFCDAEGKSGDHP